MHCNDPSVGNSEMPDFVKFAQVRRMSLHAFAFFRSGAISWRFPFSLFFPEILGRARYPFPRLGFPFGICCHQAVAFPDVAIENVGPDQGLDKPTDLASTHNLVEDCVDIFIYGDCQLLLQIRALHVHYTYNIARIGTDTNPVSVHAECGP